MALGKTNLRGLGVKHRQDAELDITAFMNLMIVLVPVLLLSMVFTRITVIDLQLPSSIGESQEQLATQQVEVVLQREGLAVNFPEGVLLRKISNTDNAQPNYKELSLVLQELKRRLQEKNSDRRSVNLLVEDKIPYHKIVSTMDAVRSYQTVVVTDVVNAELFPDIAFGDAASSDDGSLFRDASSQTKKTKG